MKEEYGDISITLNIETCLENNLDCNPLYYGDDDVFIAIEERDKDTDPNPDEQETVISIQNYKGIK